MFFLQPFLLSSFSGSFKFLITLVENLFVTAFHFILGSDVANRAVQPFFVVVANVVGNLIPRFVK